MIAKVLLPALAAISAVSAQATCTVSTTTIENQAQATGLASCRTIRGTVVLAPGSGAAIDISGPSQITGDLIVEDNSALGSFQGNDLTIVGGEFRLKNVTRLSTLSFPSLRKVQSLRFITVNNLDAMGFAPITEADDVEISDTFLGTLDGLDLTSAKTININNNRRLTKFETQLGNLSEILRITANGQNLDIAMPNLKWIANMTIANVSSFSAPSLAVVNGSARYDFNRFESFSAPNLTSLRSGDLSFVGNSDLTNISLPRLTSIGGGLLISLNGNLKTIDGFPQLKNVGGAIKMFGVFEEAEFPALDDVKGAFNVSSTADIKASCDKFKELAPGNQGGSGKVQGKFECIPLNAKAENESGEGTGSGSGGSTKKDAAAGVTINTALLALAGLAALAQAFL